MVHQSVPGRSVRCVSCGGNPEMHFTPNVLARRPAVFYSFSFAPKHDWTTFYPCGAEIAEYLREVCRSYGLNDRIRLRTDVKEIRWNESECLWDIILRPVLGDTGNWSEHDRVETTDRHGIAAVYGPEERIQAKIVVSAVGGHPEPKTPPDIAGTQSFRGEVFHSSRWRHDVELRDKNVIVVGAGCSAIQLVPRLVRECEARSVTQLMRSAPWLMPIREPPCGLAVWETWAPWLGRNIPGFSKLVRTIVFAICEYQWRIFGGTKFSKNERRKLEDELLRYLRKTAPESYHDMLTPDYEVGCKRRVFDGAYLESLHHSSMELTTRPLVCIEEKSITLGPAGKTYNSKRESGRNVDSAISLPADVIIWANGFEGDKWLQPIQIFGRAGQSLQDVFKQRGGPQMYMGTAMDGFPNFFVLFGPNTATGHSSVILASENMVNMTLKLMEPILAGDACEVEVKQEAEMAWTADIQAQLKHTVWSQGNCSSWYKDERGWNSSTYP